jgi:hypothetical protein
MDDFQLEASTTSTLEDAGKLRHFLQSRAKKEFTKSFQQFYNEFKELESNQAKLEIDKNEGLKKKKKERSLLLKKVKNIRGFLKKLKKKKKF